MFSLRVSFLLLSLIRVALSATTAAQWHIQERRTSVPASFAHVGPAPASQILNLRINLAMNNRDGLEEALMSASTPGSSSFRQWLSKEQVESFATPPAEAKQAVEQWLSSNGVEFTPTTPSGDWISLSLPVSKANALLNTQFDVFTHIESGTQSIRTLQYSIPLALQNVVRAVSPTTTFSGPLRGPAVVAVEKDKTLPIKVRQNNAVPSTCNSAITPACLEAMYNIPTTVATTTNSSGVVGLGVAGFGNQFANMADLNTFFQQFRPDVSPSSFTLTSVDGGTNSQVRTQAGVEANLDIQYTVGLAPGIPTTFVSVGTKTQDGADEGFLDIITALIGEPNPPKVLTTSYGFDTEASLAMSLTLSMCDAYMQLTSRGVSILFASGDGGVASTPGVKCSTTFPPTFPTCPFVTLVGATQNVPEIGASLSAGGFSNFFPQQSWQASAVQGYLKFLGTTFAGMFNASGRAYPDVSAQGQRVQVVVNNVVHSIAGTSCSSPIFSSVIALINDELIANGKPVLGFLNPFLYANPGAFNDITSGSNPGCGTSGFPATAGWDPVTGLGSPNFTALRAAAGL